MDPKSGVKSGNISTWVFNKQISGPTCEKFENSIRSVKEEKIFRKAGAQSGAERETEMRKQTFAIIASAHSHTRSNSSSKIQGE